MSGAGGVGSRGSGEGVSTEVLRGIIQRTLGRARSPQGQSLLRQSLSQASEGEATDLGKELAV